GRWTDAFRFVRAQTLLAAHALGVAAIDTLHAEFADEAGLRAAAEAARADGFSGMLAIHPRQVALINSAFAPTDAELAQARAIVAAFA
ncbi:aldolase/citrate lyase family protein, partial [Acinetobacter baumannii]